MKTFQVVDLLRVKRVIDHLEVIDHTIPTKIEQDALREYLEQAYDRATYLLTTNRGSVNDKRAKKVLQEQQ